jgi:hypothetical protein
MPTFARLGILGAVTALVILPGCSSLSVESEYDPTANFASYSSYQWIDRDDVSAPENSIVGRQIKAEITDELSVKGLSETDGEPDLLVIFYVGIDEKVTGATFDNFGYGYGRYYGGWGSTSMTVQSYTEGTLIVDMIDKERNELIWRGQATKAVEGGSQDPEKRRERIRKIVDKLLEDFPPSAG